MELIKIIIEFGYALLIILKYMYLKVKVESIV